MFSWRNKIKYQYFLVKKNEGLIWSSDELNITSRNEQPDNVYASQIKKPALILKTLVLLNPDIPCLCKQCRSRSVGFWRSQLIWICTVLSMHIYSNNLDEVIWLAGIRSEHGIFIYSAGQGLTLYKVPQQPPHQPEWNCIFCGLTRAFFALSQMIYLAPNGYSTLAQLRQERNLFHQIFFLLLLFFLYLDFTALSRIFHLYRADHSSKVGENRRTRGKTT